MEAHSHPKVTDKKGEVGHITGQVADPSRVLVELADGRKLLVPRLALEAVDEGEFLVAFSFDGLEEVGGDSVRRQGSQVIPIIQEEVHLGRKTVDTAVVSVHKSISERDQVIHDQVLVEEFTVDRFERNVLVETAPPIRHEDDEIVVPLLEEVLVIEKRLLLREEVHIRKVRRTEPFEQSVTLRTEQVDIQRTELSYPLRKEYPLGGEDVLFDQGDPGRVEDVQMPLAGESFKGKTAPEDVSGR